MRRVRDRRARTAALALLALHNIVQNRLLNEHGYIGGNLVVSGSLVALGHRAGLDRRDMGLVPGDIGSGLRLGGAVLVMSAGLVAAASRIPVLRTVLRDERVPVGSRSAAIRRAMTRFPFGTALFEEVAFRGVLPPLLSGGRSSESGDLESAAVFALWHLIPTHHALQVNAIGNRSMSRAVGTLVGAAAAGVAGYLLSRTRRRTGSVLAPWLIHSSVNAGSFLGVVFARSRGA